MEATYLPPIEKPRGLVMKLVFALSRRQAGKVMTPLKVFAARMPIAFGNFYGKVARLDKKLKLPSRTAMLVRQQVASINMCMFCIDANRWYAAKESEEQLALADALPEYRTSPLFTDGERAALDYVSELTRDKSVRAGTFSQLARHYSERQICDIVWLVASEHIWNMTNIGLGVGSDGLCQLRPQKAALREVKA